MSAAATKWFPVATKPVHTGVYEVLYRYSRTPVRRCFDGRAWHIEGDGFFCAFGRGDTTGEKWRGLVSNPKASKP